MQTDVLEPGIAGLARSSLRRVSQHLDLVVGEGVRQAGEVGDGIAAHFCWGRVAGRVADGGAVEPVDADADQFAARVEDLLGGVADQGERLTPRVQPAEVGDEVV